MFVLDKTFGQDKSYRFSVLTAYWGDFNLMWFSSPEKKVKSESSQHRGGGGWIFSDSGNAKSHLQKNKKLPFKRIVLATSKKCVLILLSMYSSWNGLTTDGCRWWICVIVNLNDSARVLRGEKKRNYSFSIVKNFANLFKFWIWTVSLVSYGNNNK